MRSSCTQHALERVRERLGLTAPEMLSLLDSGGSVDIGKEPGSDRMHRLFFDVASSHYFVAVQDLANGEVVTVLPLDYHNRCAWIVTPDAMTMARSLVDPCVPSVATVAPTLTHADRKPVFQVRVSTVIDGKRVRYRLCGVDPAPYAGDARTLLADKAFIRSVAEQLATQQWKAGIATLLVIRLGAKGDPTAVSLWDFCDSIGSERPPSGDAVDAPPT